jgi:uncharacterized protein YndB with AHSA1/START domain
MRSIRVTEPIAAPCETVWALLSHPESWPSWTPTVSAIRPLDGGGFRVGGAWQITQPSLGRAVWRIELIEPARRFVWTSRRPGLAIIADHVLVPTADGCEVTLILTYQGLLAAGVFLLARRLSETYIGIEARSLRERCTT